MSVFEKMIQLVANHYIGIGINLCNSIHYKTVSKMILKKYPSLDKKVKEICNDLNAKSKSAKRLQTFVS